MPTDQSQSSVSGTLVGQSQVYGQIETQLSVQHSLWDWGRRVAELAPRSCCGLMAQSGASDCPEPRGQVGARLGSGSTIPVLPLLSYLSSRSLEQSATDWVSKLSGH